MWFTPTGCAFEKLWSYHKHNRFHFQEITILPLHISSAPTNSLAPPCRPHTSNAPAVSTQLPIISLSPHPLPPPTQHQIQHIHEMAPPRQPPDLVDDAVGEILLRFPSDDPASLVHASLVCKLWFHRLTDPAFSSRYRSFNRVPPLLGFLHNAHLINQSIFPRFIPITVSSPIYILASFSQR